MCIRDRDITLGQYFPQKSLLHSTDSRMKICLVVYAIVLLFMARNFASLALAVAYIGVGMAFSKISLKLYLKSVKPVLFLVVFTGVLNIFYGTGEPLVQFGMFKITLAGIFNCIFVSVRIIALILASSVLTFTTSPTQLTDAIERLLKPLSKLRVPVHEFAMMMTIALRFVPLLLEETDKIMAAQKMCIRDRPRFTLVGATTRAGQLSAPLRDRFGVVLRLELYSPQELGKIVMRSAGILHAQIEADAALEDVYKRQGQGNGPHQQLLRADRFGD